MMMIPSGDTPRDDVPGAGAPGADVPSGELGVRSGAESGRSRRLALHFIAVLLGASGLAVAIGGLRAGISTASGVALAGANLVLMQKITSAMTATSDGTSGGPAAAGGAAWGLLLPFKLVSLVGVAYALVTFGVAQPVPLAMGFALLPLTGVFLPRPASVPDLISPASRLRRR
jgi:hypothetical protein